MKAPLQSQKEMQEPLSYKLAVWALAMMIIYLVIAQ